MGSRVGISSHLVWYGEEDARREIQRMGAGGVSTIREDFDWGMTEPAKGRFDWERPDRIVAAAAREGVSVLAIIDYSAPWASSDPSGAGDQFYLPEDPRDFAHYAAAVASRYASGGTFWRSRPELDFTPLAGIEIWNEPYGFWFAKPKPLPVMYAELARVAAAAIHAADPSVPVVASGNLMQNTGTGFAPWLSAVLDADPSLGWLIDAWAVHPYDNVRDVGPDGGPEADPRFGFESVPAVHAELLRRGITAPLWLTEIGWSTAPAATGSVSEAVQAVFMTRTLEKALVEWGDYVDRVYLFSWDMSSGTADDFEGNHGLRRADGTLKPAWLSIKQFIAANSP